VKVKLQCKSCLRIVSLDSALLKPWPKCPACGIGLSRVKRVSRKLGTLCLKGFLIDPRDCSDFGCSKQTECLEGLEILIQKALKRGVELTRLVGPFTYRHELEELEGLGE